MHLSRHTVVTLVLSIAASSASATHSLRQKADEFIAAATTTVDFSFIDGATHSLTDGTVEASFCDASSPVSLSGYMDVTGSKYDSRGEDKHLFYWMHEKRGKTKATDPSIPFYSVAHWRTRLLLHAGLADGEWSLRGHQGRSLENGGESALVDRGRARAVVGPTGGSWL